MYPTSSLFVFPDRSSVLPCVTKFRHRSLALLMVVLMVSLFALVSRGGAQLTTPSVPGVAWGLDSTRIALTVTTPKTVAGDVIMASSSGATFYVKADGTLWAAGSNYQGQQGNGTTSTVGRSTPVQIATNVVSVSAGSGHTLFIKTDGSLWGMGSNSNGELGDGTMVDHLVPVQIATGVKSASAGAGCSLFVKNDNTLWGMGTNYNGQLLDGTTNSQPLAIQVASNVAVATADSWGACSYFIKTDGTLWGAGANALGQLGDGTTIDRTVPVQIATQVRSVVAGQWYALFVKTDGTLWGMGSNTYGQLGDGTTVDRSSPVQVASAVTSATTGSSHSLFFKTDGTLWAFGSNTAGELGTGSVTATPVTSPVQSISGATFVAASGGSTFFVMADKTLRAVGENWAGQLADRQPLPGYTLFGRDVTALSAEDLGWGNLFVKADGTLWEERVVGQLSQVPGVTNVAQAVVGGYGLQRLYLKTDGTLWKLADDDTSSQIASDVRSMGAGLSYVVYLKADGTLWGQGKNDGLIQFGDGVAPFQVADHVQSLSAAPWHFLYVKQDQTLWGMGTPWGTFSPDGTYGQFISTPTQLETGIATGYAYNDQNLYIRTDGSLWTRGNGWAFYTGPAVQVDTGVTSASHSVDGTFYLKADGILRSRTGFQGTLGPVTTVAESVFSVSGGPNAWFMFLQTKDYGFTPSVMGQPESVIAALGSVATFKVVTSGYSPLAYQWFKDGVAISWAHSNQLVIPCVTLADQGNYTAVVSNSAGSVTSGIATLSIPLPPAISSSLKAGGEYGKSFSYQITASNQPDYFDATGLPAGLSIDHHTGVISGMAGAAGVFPVTLAASNAAGTDFKSLKLTIDQAKAGIVLSNFLQIYDGSPKAVTVVTSPAGLATKVTYNGNATVPTAAGIYVVIATITDPNYQGSSLGVLVIGLAPLHIVNDPVSTTVIAGHTATFTVTTEGSGPITYQWKKGATIIAGATGATLSVPNVAAGDAGQYSVVVSNGRTTLTSASATLTVITPVKISAQPVSLTRTIGQSASFSVTATGTGPLTYQWRKGATAIAGATSSTLKLTNVHAIDAGSYTVVVSNAAGSVTSAAATLTVH